VLYGRKILAGLAMLAMLLPLLVACGGETAAPATTAPAPAANTPAPPAAGAAGTAAPAAAATNTTAPAAGATGKTQLTMATWAGADESKELQAIIDKINAAAPDYQIVYNPAPADYYTKIQTMIAGNQAPDLFWLDQDNTVPYADKGALLDLTDMLKADKSPAADLTDYFPSQLATAQYNGKTYGLPWIAQPVMMYYNPALFDAAGLKQPDDTMTWDDFKTDMEKLTKPDGSQFGTTLNGWPPIQMFVWQAGGEVISEDLKTSPVDSPEALAGEQFYADLIYNKKYAPSEATIKEQGFEAMMRAGKVATFFGGAADSYDYDHAKDPKIPVLKVAPLPKNPKTGKRTTFAWTASTVVSASTKNPAVAYKALIALTDGIQHWKIPAPRKSLATADVITQSVPGKKDSAALIVQAMQDMRSERVIPRMGDWNTVYSEQFQTPLFHGKGTAADLAAKARAKLEETLPGH
jgi:multiple sugar transport system substrate-binding protein